MQVPEGVIAKVEILVYDDGSISVLTHPTEEAAVKMLQIGIDILNDNCDVAETTSVYTPGMISATAAEA